jgi:ABC-type transport system involved in multi-copper enzyme maturation permease subunit
MPAILAIARNGFLESIRQPVFIVVVLLGILAMIFNQNLAGFTMGDDDKLLVDLGLSTLFLTGLVLAAFTASSVLSKEIENKTVLTVVSKPISRPAVIVGKFLGVAGAMTLGYYILATVFLLVVRHKVYMGVGRGEVWDGPVLTFGILGGGLALLVAGLLNYLYRRPFPSTFAVCLAVGMTAALGAVSFLDREWWPQHPLTDFKPQVMIAIGLVFQAILVLTAVAVAASTRVGQVLTLLICVGVFLAGLVSEFFLGRSFAAAAGPLERLLAPLYVAVPNLQYFWTADALTQGNDITLGYFLTVTAYAGLLITALMSLAVILFQRRDVG